MINKIKAVTVSASTLLLLSSGIVLADEVTITDNGIMSDNTVVVTESTTNVVSQTNTAVVENVVLVSGNTGENEASGNTGGDVNVTTGDSTTVVSVDNTLNKNYAESDPCCEEGGLDVSIKDNGFKSDNTVVVSDFDLDVLEQENEAVVENVVEVSGNTGGNDANGNTGGDCFDECDGKCEGECDGQVGGLSDPSITTGNTDVLVDVSTKANLNVADDEECCEEDPVSVTIKDNGICSDNTVKLFSFSKKFSFQKNFALVGNLVGVSGNTGDNEANGNTGGEVNITTGGFSAFVSIFNKLNKNFLF